MTFSGTQVGVNPPGAIATDPGTAPGMTPQDVAVRLDRQAMLFQARERVRDVGILTLMIPLLLTAFALSNMVSLLWHGTAPGNPAVWQRLVVIGGAYLPLAWLGWQTVAGRRYALWLGFLAALLEMALLLLWMSGSSSSVRSLAGIVHRRRPLSRISG